MHVNIPNNQTASQKMFPFAPIPKAYENQQPFLGGRVLIVPSATSGVQVTIPHNLKAVPKSLIVIYVSGVYSPNWFASASWTTTNIYVTFNQNIASNNKLTLFVF